MASYLIITAVGPDRPGLVDDLASYLADREVNIEGSRMAAFGGEFAVIMLASGANDQIEALAADPSGLAASAGLQVFAKHTDPPSSRPAPPSLPFKIMAAGMDHPGIVQDLAEVLHAFAVNIESMDTKVAPAPVSGTPVFTMEAALSVPAAVKIRELRRALDELGDDLNMDVEFEPLEKR